MSKYSFSKIANVKFNRSKFDLSQGHKTTLNVGDLCPIYVQEVYPGDSFKVKTAFVARASVPFIKVPMDELFIDMYYFFVPNRLVYTKWAQIFGENTSSSWVPTNTVAAPLSGNHLDYNVPGTVANYMGLPYVSSPNDQVPVNALPFRAFALIWNEWFRDQNVQAPVYINTSAASEADNNTSDWSSSNYMGKVPKINKVHDYFTSCLPGTQKGNEATVPLAGSVGKAPVKTQSAAHSSLTTYPLKWKSVGGTTLSSNNIAIGLGGTSSGLSSTYATSAAATINNGQQIAPANLYADLAGISGAINVNDLRFAFQLQKMLELDARGGTRYTEYLLNHFGCINPDARLQRPEFLGGKRQPLALQQVSSTVPDNTNPQASNASYSLSGGVNGFSKSFTEHGFIIGVAAIRYFHTYQQGVERFWSRSDRTDYYDPLFAHLGEQPVYRKEIYALGGTSDDNVFGYQEPWADLRFRKNLVSGMLANSNTNAMDKWHFADYYASAPLLSDAFIKETSAPVDNALTAGSGTIPNFIVDFYFNADAIRVLPTYGTPGLIDHSM